MSLKDLLEQSGYQPPTKTAEPTGEKPAPEATAQPAPAQPAFDPAQLATAVAVAVDKVIDAKLSGAQKPTEKPPSTFAEAFAALSQQQAEKPPEPRGAIPYVSPGGVIGHGADLISGDPASWSKEDIDRMQAIKREDGRSEFLHRLKAWRKGTTASPFPAKTPK